MRDEALAPMTLAARTHKAVRCNTRSALRRRELRDVYGFTDMTLYDPRAVRLGPLDPELAEFVRLRCRVL